MRTTRTAWLVGLTALALVGCAEIRRPPADGGPADTATPADATGAFPCQPGEVRECNPPVPRELVCAPGEQRCEAVDDGAEWGPCEGAVLCFP